MVDLMILKRQKLGGVSTHKDRADGVEVDMGGLGARRRLITNFNAATRQRFLEQSQRTWLEIPSLAMTGFFAQSFAERPTVRA